MRPAARAYIQSFLHLSLPPFCFAPACQGVPIFLVSHTATATKKLWQIWNSYSLHLAHDQRRHDGLLPRVRHGPGGGIGQVLRQLRRTLGASDRHSSLGRAQRMPSCPVWNPVLSRGLAASAVGHSSVDAGRALGRHNAGGCVGKVFVGLAAGAVQTKLESARLQPGLSRRSPQSRAQTTRAPFRA